MAVPASPPRNRGTLNGSEKDENAENIAIFYHGLMPQEVNEVLSACMVGLGWVWLEGGGMKVSFPTISFLGSVADQF